jgi:hypothetical protein
MELTSSGPIKMMCLGLWKLSDKQMAQSKDSKLVKNAHTTMSGHLLYSKRTITENTLSSNLGTVPKKTLPSYGNSMTLVLDGPKKEETILIMMLLSGMLTFTNKEMGMRFMDTGSHMTLKNLSIMIIICLTALVNSTKTQILFKLLTNLEAALTFLKDGSILRLS